MEPSIRFTGKGDEFWHGIDRPKVGRSCRCNDGDGEQSLGLEGLQPVTQRCDLHAEMIVDLDPYDGIGSKPQLGGRFLHCEMCCFRAENAHSASFGWKAPLV